MSDFETRIATLLNDHVDAELGPRRAAPPLRTSPAARPPRLDHWRRWTAPLAAACVVAAVVAIALVAGRGTDHHVRPVAPHPVGWHRVSLPNGRELYGQPKVGFSDTQHGWIVGAAGRRNPTELIWTTDDSGRSWTAHTPKLPGGGSIVDVSFGDPDHGWLVRNRAGGFDVFATADGGTTWTKQATFTGEGTGVDSVDRQHAWVYGRSVVATTTDGSTWTQLSTPDAAGQLQFVDANHGWLVGASRRGRTYTTSDGGQSWTVLPNPGGRPQGATLDFISPLLGWAVTPHRVLMTTDGGRTWHVMLDRKNLYLTTPSFADARRGWVFGSAGRNIADLRTSDGGRTWTRDNISAGYVLSAASRACVTIAVETSRVYRYSRCGP